MADTRTSTRPSTPLSDQAQALLDSDEDRHDEAIAVLRRALAQREPGSAALLARAYLDRGQWHRTVELLTPLVRKTTGPERAELALPLAEALTEVGDPEDTEDAYRIAISGGDPAAFNGFGVFLGNRGRTREAARALLRAAEGGDDAAPLNLVMMLWENDDEHEPGAARRAADRWADESRPTTLLALAFLRAAQARYDDAEEIYRRAARLGADRGHIEYARFLQRARDDLDAAEAELAAAEAEQEPGWALAYGLFLIDTGRPDEARGYLTHAAYWGSTGAVTALREMDGELDDD
jgi:Tfp pilus assembly protein PilF